MRDISNSIKKVMAVFLICFIALISYIMVLYVFEGEKIVSSVYNNRLWNERNSIIRGQISDRNMNVLIKSKGIEKNNQELEYVEGEIFAHTLGYMDSVYGLTGLQNIYDQQLMGKIKGTFNTYKDYGMGNGLNLQTTVDINLQRKAYELLGDNKGAVVALNPKTGEILAMVSKPSFNPNTLKEDFKSLRDDEEFPLLNRAVSGMYAPGSTFKIITTIGALENIEDIDKRIFNDEGKLVFNEFEQLSNYNGEILGSINLKNAFVHSSNVVYGMLGLEIGEQELEGVASKFYFNKDIPADGIIIDNSKFPDLEEIEQGNIAQCAIGQGEILATPIQMALVSSTIANDGVMMKPMLVRMIYDNNGKIIKTIMPKKIEQVTTRSNAQIVKEYMREVVKKGTGKNAYIDDIELCGKTGTAEHDDIPNVDEPPHSWFIGFAPYDNPQIAFAVIVENGGVGGGKAAQIAKGMVEEYLRSDNDEKNSSN